jgi:hypothetical protein
MDPGLRRVVHKSDGTSERLSQLATPNKWPSPFIAASTSRVEPVLCDTKTVAFMISHSVRHVRRMAARRELPEPIVKGRRILYRFAEIRAWALAGMPTRDRWESMSVACRGWQR